MFGSAIAQGFHQNPWALGADAMNRLMILIAMTTATLAMAQGKDLRGAYLYRAQLERVDLRGANLNRTQLSRANLKDADLRGAKFGGAYLFKADLSGADLRGAQFKNKSELLQVNVTGAKFDASTVLPFDDAEALRRGMVKVVTVERPQLPTACETAPNG
jgi:uncharacterized protein YjbI with pentapeptide repeats